MRPRSSTALAALIASLFTVVVVVATPIHLAYASVPAKVALDAVEGMIAFLTALLIYGRLRIEGERQEALLVYSLLVFGGTNLLFGVLPKIVPAGEQATVVWAPLFSRTVGAATMAVAAFSTSSTELRRRGGGRIIGAAAAGTLVAMWGAAILLKGTLQTGISLRLALDPSHPRIEGHALLLGTQLALCALLAAASIRFTMRAEASDDPLMGWLAAGTAVGAIARLNYFIFPSIYTDYVYTGDLLRLGFYLLLLWGSTLEILGYWRRTQEMALVDRLTGLNNRHGFDTLAGFQVKVARRAGTSVAALFVDLNDLKRINDELGHEEGDRALVDTAAVLRQTFRDSDVLSRLGGDEFCVLLVDAVDASGVVERLQVNVERFRDEHPRPYQLSLSAGVALADVDEGLSSLLARADRAMYRDKLAHKGSVR